MFNTSAKLRSLKRDKSKVFDSKASALNANSFGGTVNSLKTSIKNNIMSSIYVENIDSLITKVNNINHGFTSAISSEISNYNNFKNEVEEKIEEEKNRLYWEERKWREQQK